MPTPAERKSHAMRVVRQRFGIVAESEVEAGAASLYELVKGDALQWLAARVPDSIHAVVTDPPYGLVEYSPGRGNQRGPALRSGAIDHFSGRRGDARRPHCEAARHGPAARAGGAGATSLPGGSCHAPGRGGLA